jgi:F420-dependent oxidoreductase-like protein
MMPRMRIAMHPRHGVDFATSVDELAELEREGLDAVVIAEAYSMDAVSRLGYVAARTTRVELATGILPIYSRTPTLTAMTAAGLDLVSGGRFTLGIGTSGPQVIEGFHGVAFDEPVQRTRELIEICRSVWRREEVRYAGRSYTLPLPPQLGTGLGKPLKMIDAPVRANIPIQVASIGPRNVELTAELAEGWQPIFFHPDRAHAVFGDALAAGSAKRDPGLGPLQVMTSVPVAIGEDADRYLEPARQRLAFYIGGMGARGRNFYNDLAQRYGYIDEAARIQELFLDGQRAEAIAAVPDELVRSTSLIGPPAHVRDRLAAFAAAGVTTVIAQAMADTRQGRLDVLAGLKDLSESRSIPR